MKPILSVNNVLISGEAEILLGLRSDVLLWEVVSEDVTNDTVNNTAIKSHIAQTGITLSGEPEMLGYFDTIDDRGLDPEVRVIEWYLLWNEWSGIARPSDKHLQLRWFKPHEIPIGDIMCWGTRQFFQNTFFVYLNKKFENLDLVRQQEERKDGDVLQFGDFTPDDAS